MDRILWLAAMLQSTGPTSTPESFVLSQCAIVQLGASPRFYLARPDSQLEAVDLRAGKILWHTKRAAFPLMARQDRLLALMTPPPAGLGWRLAILDAASGRMIAKLPPWGDGGGTVGNGLGSSTTMEAVSQDGRDFVVWHSRVQPVSPIPNRHLPPGSTSTGAAAVDLTQATLVPVTREVARSDIKYQINPEGGYDIGPFDVDGLTVVAAREFRETFRIVLHRRRGAAALPEVMLCEPLRISEIVGVSADRRHVLGACRDRTNTPPEMLDVVIYSALSGAKVGEFLNDEWPTASVVWQDRVVFLVTDRVGVVDLSAGRRLVERPLRSLAYRGPYPPAAAPPRR